MTMLSYMGLHIMTRMAQSYIIVGTITTTIHIIIIIVIISNGTVGQYIAITSPNITVQSPRSTIHHVLLKSMEIFVAIINFL